MNKAYLHISSDNVTKASIIALNVAAALRSHGAEIVLMDNGSPVKNCESIIPARVALASQSGNPLTVEITSGRNLS